MKILYLTPGCFDMGGISRYSRYQAGAWRELVGAPSVKVLSLLGPDELSNEEPFDVDFAAGGAGVSAKARFFARALSEVAAWRPDVIHVAHLHMAAMARMLASLSRGRAVLNIYGLEVWSASRVGAAWGLRSADLVISDSEFTAEYVAAHGMRPERPVVVIHDCVDIDKFSPRPASADVIQRYGIPAPSEGRTVLSLGRLSPDASHKGYERLLAAFARVAGRCPDLRLVYAGRGALIDMLKSQAGSLGVSNRVFFTGRVEESHLPDVYRAAHIFSLAGDRGPGRGEGVPLTPLEAASCGLPAIVGNQDGSREAVADGETGFAIDPFDLDRHAELLFQLASDTDTSLEMGRRARARIVADFSYTGFIERHRHIMTRLSTQS